MSSMRGTQQQVQIMKTGSYRSAVEKRLTMWEKAEFARRFWEKDPTLWFPKPQPEIANRMGWLDLFEPMHEQLRPMMDFADGAHNEGFRNILLLGMGGSSLAPEVFQNTFGRIEDYPELLVLDSTHPDAIAAIESRIDLTRTIFIISSKSGTTIESQSLFFYFWHKIAEKRPDAGKQFAVITDPGTPLEKMAQDRGFRKIFAGPPDVGGRYSALTVFGLAPASAIGIDAHSLLDRGWDMAGASASYLLEEENACLHLGAALGEMSLAGRDKVTFITSPSLRFFPDWLEQLLAESTGKNGKGLIPIVGEDPEQAWVYRKDRLFVYYTMDGDNTTELEPIIKSLEAAEHPIIHIKVRDRYDLGQEIFRWEMAVAAAGAVLGIHPFDQPDVQLAKELARQAMEQKSARGGKIDRGEAETIPVDHKIVAAKAVDALLASARLGDYFSIQAYLAPSKINDEMLHEFRMMIRDRLKLATTMGWGPRFLHSTGQLHKGGPNSGIFIQLIDEPSRNLPAPETNYNFASLIQAQALGDFRALKQRGRRILRISLGQDTQKGLQQLIELLG